MARSWSFGRKIGAGFAFAGAVLVAVAFVGYQSTHQLIENDRQVSHTHEVRRELHAFLLAFADSEAAQRGYLLTGIEEYLEPYRQALPEISKSFDRLRALTADNPSQQRRLDELQPVMDARLAGLRRTLEERRAQGLEAAAKLVSDGEGKRWMDRLRKLVGDMDAEETRLLQGRKASAEDATAFAKQAIVGGTVVGIIFIILIAMWINYSLVKQVGSAVQHVQTSAAELQTAANQQAAGAREQSSAMNEINVTIRELLATSRQIAGSAQQVAHIAGQTAAAARTGDETMEKSHGSINGIRRQVDQIISHIVELGKKSQQIDAVLDIVAELAEQTNILAINATIEAAGAGESGRRFSVVADEIRKLADRVAVSTKEIRTLIEEVRSAVNSTVMATETGSKAVDLGARQFADVAVSFKEIGGLVITTTEASREIELSTKQQSTAVEQVNVAIAHVSQATKESEASSGQTLQTAALLAGLSTDLLRIVKPHSNGR